MLHCRRASDVEIRMPSRWTIYVLGVSFMRGSLLPVEDSTPKALAPTPEIGWCQESAKNGTNLPISTALHARKHALSTEPGELPNTQTPYQRENRKEASVRLRALVGQHVLLG